MLLSFHSFSTCFVSIFQELEFLSKIDSAPRSSGGVSSKSSGSAAPASQVYLDFQHSLEQYLRDASQLATDDVCSWIQVFSYFVGDESYLTSISTTFIEATRW